VSDLGWESSCSHGISTVLLLVVPLSEEIVTHDGTMKLASCRRASQLAAKDKKSMSMIT